jgi:hypothetical protein
MEHFLQKHYARDVKNDWFVYVSYENFLLVTLNNRRIRHVPHEGKAFK